MSEDIEVDVSFLKGNARTLQPLPKSDGRGWFGQDPSLDQAQPEDMPESKLVTGIDGVLIQVGGEENPSVTIRLDDGTDIDLWLPKIQVQTLAPKLYRRVSVLIFTED